MLRHRLFHHFLRLVFYSWKSLWLKRFISNSIHVLHRIFINEKQNQSNDFIVMRILTIEFPLAVSYWSNDRSEYVQILVFVCDRSSSIEIRLTFTVSIDRNENFSIIFLDEVFFSLLIECFVHSFSRTAVDVVLFVDFNRQVKRKVFESIRLKIFAFRR